MNDEKGICMMLARDGGFERCRWRYGFKTGGEAESATNG